MKNVLFALLETSLYAAVIAAAIALFRRAFKKRASARFQYLVWLLLIARLLMPVTPESGLHVDALFPAPVSEQVAAGQSGGVADRQPDPALRPAAPAAQNPAAQNTPYEAAASDGAHQAPRSVKRAIDPYALGFYVWCGGVALSLFWLVFVRARFARRVLSSASPISGEALSLYRACALLAGVKKPPRLMATREVASPSLALLGGRAAVLLPESLLGDAPALRYALLHELSHFRRGDHIVLTLCALLSALYWFNPAVWLAFSAMRADMESACDARVLELIEPREKRAYLLTLLSLFTKSRRPALGMAQVRTARLAKKRVEDAFRASRTGGAVRVFAAVLCAALLFTCFTTACQPTPEGDVVINKGEGTLENAIAGTPAPTAEPIASSSIRWVDEAQSDSGRVKIAIDAEIITPNVAAYPVYRIDPCADFTQEFVTAVHRELLDSCPLVNANKEMTRTEAQEAYMKTAQRLAEFEEKGEEALSVIADGRTPAEQVEWEIAFAKEEMERYAALMKTAPETVPDAYIAADAFAKNEYGDYNFEAIPEYGDYGYRAFTLFNGNDGSRGRDWQGTLHIRLGSQYFGPHAYDATREEWWNWASSGGGETPFAVLPKKLSMTPREAEAWAFDALGRIGFPMELRVASNEVCGLRNTDMSDGREENYYAHLLKLEPVIGGIPVFSRISRMMTDSYESAYYYGDEEITVAVNDTGLHEFSVEGYFTVGERINANVALMDLEAIKARTLAQLLLENAYWEEADAAAGPIEIRVIKLELGYGRTAAKDDPAGQILIPVWNVYCAYRANGEASYHSDTYYPSLTLNAIDGSRM